jgi:hypothetical protein
MHKVPQSTGLRRATVVIPTVPTFIFPVYSILRSIRLAMPEIYIG